jgi:hypothetical protein
MMRKLATLAVMMAMTGMVGCGFQPAVPEPEINELAKQVLPGTWSDPAGLISFTINDEGQITGLSGLALPDELSDLKFDGSTFSFTVPGYDMQLDAQLQPEVITVDEDGSVNIQYRGELVGFPDLIDPGYVQINVTGQLDDVNNPTGLTGSVTAIAYPSGIVQGLFDLPEQVSIAEQITFGAVKQ